MPIFPVSPLSSPSWSHPLRRVVVCAVASGALLGASLQAGSPAGALSSVAEREVQRRMAKVNEARIRQNDASQLLATDKTAEAAALYEELLGDVPETPITTDLRSQLKAGYAVSACAEAEKLLAKGRFAEADKLILHALEIKPEDPGALQLKKRAADPDRYPPALTPDHVEKVKTTEALLLMASSSHELGDYDKAASTYEAVLRKDPYNIAARRGMEKVEAARAEYFKAARDQNRAAMFNQVNALWESPVPPTTRLDSPGANSAGTVAARAKEGIERKLRVLRLPKVEFADASLDEVVEYLRVTTKNVDPDGKGIDFVMNADEMVRGKTLALSLLDTPVEEVLRYAVQLAGAGYRVDNRAVIITSLTERNTTVSTRSFIVPPDFIQTAPVEAAPAAADPFAAAQPASANSGLALKRMSAKEFLESRGVTFGADASATYSPSSSTLIVRNTSDNLALVETLVEQSNKSAPKQAKITVRMIEIGQTNLSELGFDVFLGQSNLPGSGSVFTSGPGRPATDGNSFSMTDGIRSSGPITGRGSIDRFLQLGEAEQVGNINTVSPGAFSVFGALTDPQFQTILYALDQKKGFDVLASPTVIAKSGQKSSIRVVREFFYPTEFDPPQIPQNVRGGVGSNQAAPITPTTPTTFEMKELGVVLEVEPVVSEDGKTVELSVSPSNTEFEGFIDYGSDIEIGGTALNNPIIQPVFRKNAVTTAVTIWDGSTVVLGGVVRQEVNQIDDKVPVIGDIPLVGRPFQSKVKETLTKNVVFFVSVDIIDPAGRKINQPTPSVAASN
jgi:general secretion pathway protein D